MEDREESRRTDEAMASRELIVVATALRAEHLKMETLAASPSGVVDTSGVFSLRRFVQTLSSDVDLPFRRASATAQHLILCITAEEYYRDKPNSYYGPISRTDGFIRSLSALFNELKTGYIGCAEWRTLAPRMGMDPDKTRELSDLYERYEERKRSNQRVDEPDVNRLLIERLNDPGQRFRVLEGVESVEFRDIYRLGPFRFELMCGLALRTAVRILLPLPEVRRRSFAFLEKSWRKIEGRVSFRGTMEPEPVAVGEEACPDISGFLHGLFADSAVSVSTDRVECFNGYSRYREVEEIAMRIAADLEKGIEPHRMGVIFRDLSVYGPIVEDVFDRYGVPFAFRRGNPARSNPLLKTVLTVFDAIDSDFGREEVLKLLTSSYARLFHDTDGRELLTRKDIEALVLDLRIIRGKPHEWQARVERRRRRASTRKEADVSGYDALLTWGVGFLDKLKRLSNVGNAEAFFTVFREIVGMLELDKALGQDVPFGLLYRDLAAYDSLMQSLDDLADEMAELGFPGHRSAYTVCRDELLLLLDERNIPRPGRNDLNRVLVLNAEEAVGYGFHTVYIGGLVEGEFPLRVPPHPFLRETERLTLNRLYLDRYLAHEPEKRNGREPLVPLADRLDEEALIFYLAAATAREKLVFSFPSTELGGGELLRSPYVDDSLEVLGGEAASLTRLPILHVQEDLLRTFNVQEMINKTVARLADGSDSVPGPARFLLERFPDRMESVLFRMRVEEARGRAVDPDGDPDPTLNNYLGLVSDPAILEHMKARRRAWQVTGLERYGSCPFGYWMTDVLGLEPVERPKIETDPMSMGQAVHRVLERYHGEEKGHRLEPDDRVRCMERLVAEVFDEMERRDPDLCGEINFWRILRRQARQILLAYVEWDPFFRNRFEPVKVEYRMGPPPSAPADETAGYLELVEPVDPPRVHRFSGIVDRMDLDPDTGRICVWDYKFASNAATYREKLTFEALGATSFQVPLYLLAAARALRETRPDAEMYDGGYLLLKNIVRRDRRQQQNVRLRSRDTDETALRDFLTAPGIPLHAQGEEDIPGFQTRLFATIRSIESGRFRPGSGRDATCSRCAYSSVCRSDAATGENDG